MIWSPTLAQHKATNRLWATQHTSKFEEWTAAARPLPDMSAVAITIAKGITCRLGKLPDDQSTAPCGAYLGGANHVDLAAKLNVPPNMTRKWIRRSGLVIRECIPQ